MHENIIKRNFQAINEAFKEDRKKDSQRDDRIRHLEEQLAMLIRENQALQQKVNILFAKVMGGGATQ